VTDKKQAPRQDELLTKETWRRVVTNCMVPEGRKVDLNRDYDPAQKPQEYDKESSAPVLSQVIDEMIVLQDRFYAESSRALLIVFQATDAAGKDGTIKHVMSGLNPEGVEVHSFKAPSHLEAAHDFLWRHQVALPELGRIAIFNRSHYENVLVTKVHPELIWPPADQHVNREKLWERRYHAINEWERHLVDSGTAIVKIFLNLSKDVQRERFLQRIDEPEKNWKFSPADLHERERWDEYRGAFSDMLSATSTKWAPWYVVPADHKWATRLITSAIILHALEVIDPHYPQVDAQTRAELMAAREHLDGE